MDCEYGKYGCTTKLANADHIQAHYQHHIVNHLNLVTSALDAEVDKNKALTTRVTTLERAAKEAQDKYSTKTEELESKWKIFQGM
jgi:hypothetical protein